MKIAPSTSNFVPALNISSLSVQQIHEELLKRKEKEVVSFCIKGKLDIIPSVHVGFSLVTCKHSTYLNMVNHSFDYDYENAIEVYELDKFAQILYDAEN